MKVFSPWQGFHNDPWFWQFPKATLIISMASFLTVATPWTIIAWLDPGRCANIKSSKTHLSSR